MTTRQGSKTGPKGIPAPKSKAAPAQAPATAAEAGTEPEAASTRAGALKLRELVDRVVDATGAKKKTAKEIVEATLAKLGDALAKGEELNLPGVGKVRVAKSSDREGRSLMTLKVRSGGGGAAAKKKANNEALAEASEDV